MAIKAHRYFEGINVKRNTQGRYGFDDSLVSAPEQTVKEQIVYDRFCFNFKVNGMLYWHPYCLYTQAK